MAVASMTPEERRKRVEGARFYYTAAHVYEFEDALLKIDVVMRAYDSEGDEEVDIARGQFWVVDLDSTHPLDALDAEQELWDFTVLFSKSGDEWSKATLRQLGFEPSTHNLLVGNILTVAPEWRGTGLIARNMLNQVERVFGRGCALTALKSHPLQFSPGMAGIRFGQEWSERMGFDNMHAGLGKAKAFAQLEKHYKRLALKKVRGTDILIREIQQ